MSWEMTICHILEDIQKEAKRHNKVVEELLHEIRDEDKEYYYDESGNKCDID